MDIKRLAKVLKALSHPNRLEIYLALAKKNQTAQFDAGGECLITDIIRSLKIGAPTISHHLKELENADLITTERRGKFLIAKLNEKTRADALRILSAKTPKR